MKQDKAGDSERFTIPVSSLKLVIALVLHELSAEQRQELLKEVDIRDIRIVDEE